MKYLMPVSHDAELASGNPTQAIVSIDAGQVSYMLDRINQIQRMNPKPDQVHYIDNLANVECLIAPASSCGCLSVHPIQTDPAGTMFDVRDVVTVFSKYGDDYSVYCKCQWLDGEGEEYSAEINSLSHELLLSLASPQIPADSSKS